MSSHVKFTPVQPQDDTDMIYTSRNSHGAGVRILDLDGLHDALSETMVDQMDTRRVTDRDEYPAKEWELLLGFSTFSSIEPGGDADFHNVSNTGPKDMADVWATVSQYTEPFVVYQTGFEGSWPHAASVDGQSESMYRVEAADGDVTMEELTVGIINRERVDL